MRMQMGTFLLVIIFGFYIHKNIFLDGFIQNRLDRLIPFKRHLNRVNTKQRVTDCLSFIV